MKKYEITDIVHPDNPNLHRIRAVTDLKVMTTSTKRVAHGFRRMPSPVKMQLSAAMQSLQITPLQRAALMSERTPP